MDNSFHVVQSGTANSWCVSRAVGKYTYHYFEFKFKISLQLVQCFDRQWYMVFFFSVE